MAREAFGLAPERIAVTSRLAELQIKTGDARRATKTLERGWSLAPHPDLAALYLKASGESDPLKRVGVVRKLAAHKPDDMESHLALAQATLEAGLWGEARRHLDAAGGSNPSVRVCRLMADLEERAESDQTKVRDWLARAAEAPADKAWRCTAPAARITRPGIRCARAAAPSAPCIGARPGPSARSWRLAARRSRRSA